jgi:hypothetical protein
MFKRLDIIRNITQNLSWVCKNISLQNPLGLYDMNIGAENFYGEILNRVYGLSLVNLNIHTSSYPAIDLADFQRRICVQVTSEKKAVKLRKTMEVFEKHGMSKQFDKIVFLIIDDNASPSISKPAIPYESKNMKDLVRDIDILSEQEITALNSYIDNALSKPSIKNASSFIPVSKLPTFSGRATAFLKKFQFNENEYHEIRGDLQEIASMLASISHREKELIYYFVENGTATDGGLALPTHFLDTNIGNDIVYPIYESLKQRNIMWYDEEYYQDIFSNPTTALVLCKADKGGNFDYFSLLQDFCNNDQVKLHALFYNADFSVLD